MPSRRTQLGWRGEGVARRWLEQRGFAFLAERFRTRQGEIDLVMKDGDLIVFVEVKTRRSRTFGAPEESVNDRKLERLAQAGAAFLQERKLDAHPVRFDLVVLEQRGKEWSVRHIPGIC